MSVTGAPPMLVGVTDDAAFAGRLYRLGPFEPRPHIAAAVSGGGDSLALALLADAWARARGGRMTALIVDHSLTPGSDRIAEQTRKALAARGMDARVLTAPARAPETGIEAYARGVRYALLRAACAKAHILHLLTAHTQEDQAETLLLRLGAGSGEDGLAAMTPVFELPEVRLLRPLLDVPKAALRARLEGSGLVPFEDPMNADSRFRRVRVRGAAAGLARAGLSAERLAGAAAGFARARAALETEAARLTARAVRLDALGFATLKAEAFAAAPDEISARAFARVLAAVGGREYPPSPSRAHALAARLLGGGRRGALAGCVVEAREGVLTICRETRSDARWMTLEPGARAHWDRRFDVFNGLGAPVQIGASGAARAAHPGAPLQAPKAALSALPAVWPGAAKAGAETPEVLIPEGAMALSSSKIVHSGPFRPVISLSALGSAIV
ncbi:MAG: tRNA lysidine(34) synthetase TilS [Rhodospirillales bacterium]